jgi:hypothetical protein
MFITVFAATDGAPAADGGKSRDSHGIRTQLLPDIDDAAAITMSERSGAEQLSAGRRISGSASVHRG